MGGTRATDGNAHDSAQRPPLGTWLTAAALGAAEAQRGFDAVHARDVVDRMRDLRARGVAVDADAAAALLPERMAIRSHRVRLRLHLTQTTREGVSIGLRFGARAVDPFYEAHSEASTTHENSIDITVVSAPAAAHDTN